MQIKYRITLVYTFIVTVILLLLCSSIFFASLENRTDQFYNRLTRKGISIGELLLKHRMSGKIITEINMISPSSIVYKSISVLDSNFNSIYVYQDEGCDTLIFSKEIYNVALRQSVCRFSFEDKKAIAVSYTHNNKTYVIAVASYDAEIKEWIPKLKFILVVSFFISISIVIISGYAFSLRLVKSIRDLTNMINHISTNNLSMRLPFGSGKDELQQLAITTNSLLDRLQSSFETQRRFIDNASHELSTPMASISSSIDIALQKDRTSEQYKEILHSVYDDITRLSSLVKSLLEIAKISGSAKGLEILPVRMDELIMRLPSDLKKLNPKFEAKLNFGEIPDVEDELLVYGNEELIYSAIKNIAQNACKYSQNGIALVTITVETNQIVIIIKDNGPGINADEISRIFQPFYRSYDVNQTVGGFGLGLPLANQIIKLYNGSIQVNSELNKGTIFTISLPKSN